MPCRKNTANIANKYMLKMKRHLLRNFFTVLLLLISSIALAQTATSKKQLLNEARTLIESGQSQQSYNMLVKHELDYAGQVDFDYWLGVASLAAGQYIMATLAYERVLIIEPENNAARFDMGLAYLRMGNNERALQEFELVRQANPQKNIRIMLDEAIAQARVDKTQLTLSERLSGSLSMKIGYDSNINYSTSDNQFLAYLNGFPVLLALNPDNVSKSDKFAHLLADVAYQKPLTAQSLLEFRAYGSALQPFNETQFGTLNANASAAYQYFAGKSRWEAGLDAGESWLDGHDYMEKLGGWLGWRQSQGDSGLIDIAAMYHEMRYQQRSLRINDYDQTLLVGRLLHKMPGKPMVVSFGALAGYEDALYRSANGDKHLAGLNFGLQGPVSYASSAYINFGFAKSFYQNTNVLFLQKREDDELDFKVGLIWLLDKQTDISAELEMHSTKSNIPIYSYDRSVLGLTFRKSFGD